MNIDTKEWLFNLNCLYNHIVNAFDSHFNLYKYLDKIGDELMSDIDAIFISYILIYANSLVDEFNINQQNIELRKVSKPPFQYINKTWPDIKKLRNSVLAHNHRNKENKSIYFDGGLSKYRVPNGNVEIELIVYLLGLVVEATNKHYKYDYNAAAALLPKDEVDYNQMDVSEANKVKVDTLNQMNSLITQFNKNRS